MLVDEAGTKAASTLTLGRWSPAPRSRGSSPLPHQGDQRQLQIRPDPGSSLVPVVLVKI